MANVLWIAFICVLLLQQSSGQGSCTCKWTDPTTNKTITLDISTAFTYPLSIPGAGTSGYDYKYSPCTTIPCGTATPTDSNVCQIAKTGTLKYNAGKAPVWNVINSTYFVITYSATTGTTTRVTTVTFVVDPTATANSVSPVTEGTAGKFSFTVTLTDTKCTPDPTYGGCICRSGSSVLDISNSFHYPYTIKDQDDLYEYTFSPCKPIACGGGQTYVCQKACDGTEYIVGTVPNWTIHNITALNFTINYTVPESPRSTVVNFYQNPAAQFNTTTKVAEYPTFTYTFNVTLAPKPTCTPDPVFGGCVCKGPSFTLDISQTFNYPMVINGSEKTYDYVFSPCTPVTCGSPPSAATVCQKDAITGMEYTCGVNPTWVINSVTFPLLNFTVIYTVPGSPRTTIVNFLVREGNENKTTAVAEYITNTYNFNVTLSTSPGASLWTKAVNKLSNIFFFKKG